MLQDHQRGFEGNGLIQVYDTAFFHLRHCLQGFGLIGSLVYLLNTS